MYLLSIFSRALVLVLRVVRVFLVDGRAQDADVRQVAVALGVIETIANNKAIGYLEAGVVQFNNLNTLSSLVKKRADAQAQRSALPQYIHLVVQREATIDDIFDN